MPPNPGLAPREKRCRVCAEVLAIEDVTWRIFDETGARIPNGLVAAKEYCKSVGMDGTRQRIHNALVKHRTHVEAYLAKQARRGDAQVPLEGEGNVVRILEPTGPVRWLDVNSSAMEVGRDALAAIKERLEGGLMDDSTVLAVARLGMTAAHKRGDLESKGRKLSQVDELLKLASGLPRAEPA